MSIHVSVYMSIHMAVRMSIHAPMLASRHLSIRCLYTCLYTNGYTHVCACAGAHRVPYSLISGEPMSHLRPAQSTVQRVPGDPSYAPSVGTRGIRPVGQAAQYSTWCAHMFRPAAVATQVSVSETKMLRLPCFKYSTHRAIYGLSFEDSQHKTLNTRFFNYS